MEQAGHELVVAVSRAAVAPTKVTAVERRKWLLLAARAFENAGEPSYAAGVSRPPPARPRTRAFCQLIACVLVLTTPHCRQAGLLLQGQATTPLLHRLTLRILAALP